MQPLRDRFTTPKSPHAPTTRPDIAAMPEHECWLLANAHLGPRTRPARLALAAYRSKERAPREAMLWLIDIAFGDGADAEHAARVLEVVA
jgi:hypothetical protein